MLPWDELYQLFSELIYIWQIIIFIVIKRFHKLKINRYFIYNFMVEKQFGRIHSYCYRFFYIQQIKFYSFRMLKNKTLEFKRRYSNSASKKHVHHASEHSNDLIQQKLNLTGFTTYSQASTTTNQPKKMKRMAKVQSSSFIKTKKHLDNCYQKIQTKLTGFRQNQTSFCRYSQLKKPKIENLISRKQNYSQTGEKSIIQEKKIARKTRLSIEQFLSTLTPRSLFFCCKCFRYIFAIEKNLHYPKCQNQIKIDGLKIKQKQAIGFQKLKMILQLSEYTKNRYQRIQKLYKAVKNNRLSEYDQIQIYQNGLYYKFQQIVQAFLYTYQKLIKREQCQKSGIFSFKKVFSCVEAINMTDSKSQKEGNDLIGNILF